MDIGALRDKIDRIDDELFRLLKERMALVKSIGDEKNKLGLTIKNEDREKEILSRLLSSCENDECKYIEGIYSEIFRQMRAMQEQKTSKI